jgi:hypothetical protein
MTKKMKIDLTELRSEYESTYLYYYKDKSDCMTFEEWLEKIKNIKLKLKNK